MTSAKLLWQDNHSSHYTERKEKWIEPFYKYFYLRNKELNKIYLIWEENTI